MKLTDVFVGKLMCQANSLWLMLHGFAIDDGLSKLVHDGFVDSITLMGIRRSHIAIGQIFTHKILDGAAVGTQHDRR